ncbi:hypothetical protein [Paenibacillus radicis (ex Xue et al. 2023)]|uniref:Uncharacterized protein n=1 Tax=Paenibacillus radicis (ex Xue et al. 2023) TaxID=2972489 RepID=A0ABT1YCX9_9BACL|nr:hypothetical protein [Paenibacillus radicis (ex Xue et al. 2023)]MCR8631060.1 hypothetical protein [Paenibacillus radicis (ex Xue et al. 2023)]
MEGRLHTRAVTGGYDQGGRLSSYTPHPFPLLLYSVLYAASLLPYAGLRAVNDRNELLCWYSRCTISFTILLAQRSPAHNLKQHAGTASTEVKGDAEVIVPLSPEKSKNQSDKGTVSSVQNPPGLIPAIPIKIPLDHGVH